MQLRKVEEETAENRSEFQEDECGGGVSDARTAVRLRDIMVLCVRKASPH